MVTAGETVVAMIDPVSPTLLDQRTRASAEARRDSASANLEKAQATHEFALHELRRFKKLYADKTISAQELEGGELREASAEKEESAANSALKMAQAELDQFVVPTPDADGVCAAREVRAPASGRILRVWKRTFESFPPARR